MQSFPHNASYIFRVIIALVFTGSIFGVGVLQQFSGSDRYDLSVVPIVQAEDDEEEDEEEDEDDDERSSPSSSTTETQVITTYEVRNVEKTISTLDPKFTEDHDGDGLVDGIDPHMTVNEKEFFTDNDGDSVANALDKYPGIDDFFSYTDEDDANENGILDFYE